jgi:membrane-associated protease RseP (regulator of RpoE activity)
LSQAIDETLKALASGAGLQFTVAMISILFVHEMGHFIAGRRRQIITSWPYFIPAPNIIGTFGAIIKSKSPFWNRRDLIEVGAAGPIAGWIVALGWLIYGLSHSSIVTPEIAANTGEMVFSLQGKSILMRLATLALIGPVPEGQFYFLSEAAFAGWVGLLVTAINLLPIGQLDGGHILYGLFRTKQRYLAMVAMVALLALGFQSPMWWFFAAFGLFFGVKHPPTLNDNFSIGRTAFLMAIGSILILILSFTPVPFR